MPFHRSWPLLSPPTPFQLAPFYFDGSLVCVSDPLSLARVFYRSVGILPVVTEENLSLPLNYKLHINHGALWVPPCSILGVAGLSLCSSVQAFTAVSWGVLHSCHTQEVSVHSLRRSPALIPSGPSSTVFLETGGDRYRCPLMVRQSGVFYSVHFVSFKSLFSLMTTAKCFLVFFVLFVFYFSLFETVSHGNAGKSQAQYGQAWPWTPDPLASTSQVLGLQTCTTKQTWL